MTKEPKLLTFYKKNFKKLMIIPALLLIFSMVMIAITQSQEGPPIYRDVSLKGGLSSILNVDSEITADEFQQSLEEEFSQNTFVVSELFEQGRKVGFIVDTDLEEETFMPFIDNYFGTSFEFGDNYTSNFISPSLSSAFFKQAIIILLVSFVLMSTVIFLYFKQFVPSFAVVLSAAFDLIVTVGVLNAMQFQISIAGIGALLMIIGYSIDTDVLLTNRLIKEFGFDYFEKTWFAFKTGLLMTTTTLVAGLAALIITNSDVVFEIALILVIGLIVDFISTWFQNSGILLWWLEKSKN